MKKIFLFAALLALAGCQKAELPEYSIEQGGINFYAEPAFLGDIISYPDDLTVSFEGYAAGSLELGLKAFAAAPPATNVDLMVEIMGRVQSAGRKVALRVDKVGDMLDVALSDDYVVPGGEGRATFGFAVTDKGLAPGQTAQVVLGFDTADGDFIAGVDNRQTYTLNYKAAGTALPSDEYAYSEMAMAYWDWGFYPGYGARSLTKVKFIAVAMNTINFDVSSAMNILDDAATLTTCKAKLAEYKALSEADPATYPPLYQSGTTWISFP